MASQQPPQPQPQPQAANMTRSPSLYIGDLKPEVTEAMLHDLFSKYGPISSIKIVRDFNDRSRLYGYINFANLADAHRALEFGNYTPLLDKPCRLSWAHTDPTSRKSGVANLFVDKLPAECTSKELHDLFSPFGNVLSCKVLTDNHNRSRGHGCVQFEKEEEAKRALAETNGTEYHGSHLQVVPFESRPKKPVDTTHFNNLYVKNLDDSVTDEVLARVMGQYGHVTSATIMRDTEGKSRHFGFANFETPEQAVAAKTALHESTGILGQQKIYADRAQSKQERQQVLAQQHSQPSVYVKNLAENINEEELRKLFSGFGTITGCHIMRDRTTKKSRGFGFVSFATREEMQASLAANGQMVMERRLYVATHMRREERSQYLQTMWQQRSFGGGRGGYGGAPPMYPPAPYGFAPMMPYGRPPMGGGFYPPYMGGGMRGPNMGTGPRGPRVMGGGGRGRPPQGAPYQRPPQPQSAVYRPGVRNQPAPGAQAPAPQAPVEVAAPQPQSDPFIASLATLPVESQKEQLGNRLYAEVEKIYPDQAGKITGMLLEMDVSDLVQMIYTPHELQSKMKEAHEILQADIARQRAEAGPAATA